MHHGHVRTHGEDVHRAHSARGRKTEDGGSVEESGTESLTRFAQRCCGQWSPPAPAAPGTGWRCPAAPGALRKCSLPANARQSACCPPIRASLPGFSRDVSSGARSSSESRRETPSTGRTKLSNFVIYLPKFRKVVLQPYTRVYETPT